MLCSFVEGKKKKEFLLADLNDFSRKARGDVSVREGQGVVLMCTPPPHSPGNAKLGQTGAQMFLREAHICEDVSQVLFSTHFPSWMPFS